MVDDPWSGVRSVMASTAGVTNLVGPLGAGKSTFIRTLAGAVLVDFDRPHAASALDASIRERGARDVVVADNVDGRARLESVRDVLASTRGRVVVVSRAPVGAVPGWPPQTRVVAFPLPDDDAIAAAAVRAGAGRRDVDAVVRMAAGVPLVAEVAARGLHGGAVLRPEGPLADQVAAAVLQRLDRELPGQRRAALLRKLATLGAGDERQLGVGPGLFTAVAELSVVQRGPAGLTVAEPYRSVFESAYRWRDPEAHERVRARAAAYRIGRLAAATGLDDRRVQLREALFLQGDRTVRTRVYPPGRPPLPVRAATAADATTIGRLMHRWATGSGFHPATCERLAQTWIDDDVAGFQLAEAETGVVGLIRLATITERTAAGIEPLLQQHGDDLLTGGGAFLGTSFCPDPVVRAQMFRHILDSALTAGRLLVSTASPDYQELLGALRFRRHGPIRDDTFRCGAPPQVYSNQFAAAALPAWLDGLRDVADPDRVRATAWALARLRGPALAGSPLLRGKDAASIEHLRATLIGAVSALADSTDSVDAEAGRILTAYYLGPPRTHVQIALQMHLSRATYFRRLRHGHVAVAELLGTVVHLP